MKTVNIGLMGFGRIGRNLLRISLEDPKIKINTIADTASKDNLAYLLKYDSIYGTLNKEIEMTKNGFSIEGHQINFFSWEKSKDTKWKEENIDIVIQATGKPQSKSECLEHLSSGAKRVILASTPTDLSEIPIYVPGTQNIDLDSDIISLGSNTSIAAGPVLDVLDKKYGILNAYISTIHGYSISNRLSDVAGEGLRRNRAAGENIIPKMTQSARVIEHAIPNLRGKIASASMTVPVPDGSTLDLTIHFSKKVGVEEVNNYLEEESQSTLKDYIGLTKDPIVSSDVVGSRYSGVVDSLATIGIGKDKIKLLIWFDNGWGYSSQIIDIIKKISFEGKNE